MDSAKQIVIEEAEGYAKKLENGNAGDLPTMGRLLVLLNKMVTAIYIQENVTVEECQRMHNKTRIKSTRIKFGSFEIEAPLSAALLMNLVPISCCAILGFALGKANGWW